MLESINIISIDALATDEELDAKIRANNEHNNERCE